MSKKMMHNVFRMNYENVFALVRIQKSGISECNVEIKIY